MRDTSGTYSVTSAPSEEPISTAEIKTRLRVTSAEFDNEIGDLAQDARAQVEHDASVCLVTQTLTLSLDRFPTGRVIDLKRPPVQSVTSVGYTDDDRTAQTFAASKYDVDTGSKPGRIVLRESESWPTIEYGFPNAVVVTFVAGYGTASDVPVYAKLAIVEAVRLMWDRCSSGDPDQIRYENLIRRLAWTGIVTP